jgi:hypothetical protein
MNFPLTTADIALWLVATAIILLITSELIYSLPDFSARIKIDRSRLRLVAMGCGLGFLVIVVIRIFQPL